MNPPRIVLDTNVCLDLLLFRDTRSRTLAQALHAGRVQAAGNAETRQEWQRVLGYPILQLDPSAQNRLADEWDALTGWVHAAPAATGMPSPHAGEASPAMTIGSGHGGSDGIALPRCADPDDQKFLELAAASGARWLLSRDRALLALAGRCRRAGLFRIATPETWSLTD